MVRHQRRGLRIESDSGLGRTEQMTGGAGIYEQVLAGRPERGAKAVWESWQWSGVDPPATERGWRSAAMPRLRLPADEQDSPAEATSPVLPRQGGAVGGCCSST